MQLTIQHNNKRTQTMSQEQHTSTIFKSLLAIGEIGKTTNTNDCSVIDTTMSKEDLMVQLLSRLIADALIEVQRDTRKSKTNNGG